MDHKSYRNLTVTRYTKGTLPRLPFLDMKEEILGKTYELSIAFVGRDRARELNYQYRNKNYATTVLSWALSDDHGELVLHLEAVRRQAKEHRKPYHTFLTLLVIHGMLHLKGYDHGSTMEAKEAAYMHRFCR